MSLGVISAAMGDNTRVTATIGLMACIKRMFPVYLPLTQVLGEYPGFLKLTELLQYPLFLHEVGGVISLSE